MNQSLLNSLVVLSVSLVLLIYSFVRKTRRWFLVSAVALLGLTLYITGDFLAAVAWWAYLLLAGIVLIVVAAVTEYLRQRAAKNPQEERFFVDWKW
jgi:CHASE2 domain-containing sensor protein